MEIDWPTRKRICVGIAKGLASLHEDSVLKMVHRDIKATNVLLDSDLTPKISDFGLAKLHEEENTHITTIVAGTMIDYPCLSFLIIRFSLIYIHFVFGPAVGTWHQNMHYGAT